MESVKLDIAPLIEYSTNKMLSIIGKDPATNILRSKLNERIKIYLHDASYVKSIGMANPIPIINIYQDTRLKSLQEDLTNFERVIKSNKHIIIRGGPGSGKSIFLNWILYKSSKDKRDLTIMFRLRVPNEIQELSEFVEDIINSKAVKKKEKFILLVDGYDEVDNESRKWVSKILNKFIAANSGRLILTSRYYYHAYDLKVEEIYIAPFSPSNAENYLESYLDLYKVEEKPKDLIRQLKEYGFEDFLENPLMLTLICVLKTGSLKYLPKNTLSLVERAVQTLTWRWDESKGIVRDTTLPLDGRHRVDLLEQIAFAFPSPEGPEAIAIRECNNFLNKMQYESIEPFKLLEEISQWYGIFIPTMNVNWIFTHRTMHDYLAAKYWVKTGQFSNDINSIKDWNTRTAYAACMSTDATKCIVNSLKKSDDENVLMECILNNAPFKTKLVAQAIVKHINRTRKFKIEKAWEEKTSYLRLYFYAIKKCSDKLIIDLIESTVNQTGFANIGIYLESSFELIFRKRRMDYKIPISQPIQEWTYYIGEFKMNPIEFISNWNEENAT